MYNVVTERQILLKVLEAIVKVRLILQQREKEREHRQNMQLIHTLTFA